MILANTEKVSKELYSSGKFKILNTVLTGGKNQDGSKKNVVYSNQYNSKKYTDKSSLVDTTFSEGHYVVLSYKDFSDRQNYIVEEVYMSYPHLNDFKFFIEDISSEITNNASVYFNDAGVVPEHASTYWESPPMASNKILVAQPIKLKIENSANYVNGVRLFLTDKVYVELDAYQLITILLRLKDFNLDTSSSLLLNSQMLVEIYSLLESKLGMSTGVSSPSSPAISNRTTNATSPRTSNIPPRSSASPRKIGGARHAATPTVQQEPVSPPEDLEYNGLDDVELSDLTPSGNAEFANILSMAEKVSIDDLLE